MKLAQEEIAGTLHKRRISLSPTETKALGEKLAKLQKPTSTIEEGLQPRKLEEQFKHEEAVTETHVVELKEDSEKNVPRGDGKVLPLSHCPTKEEPKTASPAP